MSSPSDPSDERDGPVDLTKGAGDSGSTGGTSSAPAPTPPDDEPFDPYRFGRPDHPVPPEFAPPGYVPDPAPAGGPPPWPGPPSAPWPGPAGPPGQPSQPGPPGQPYEPYVSPYPWNAPPGPQGPPGAYGPYGPSGPYQPAPTGSGKAVTALVLGIGSIVMFWTSILDAVLAITAVVFGLIALNEHRARANANAPTGGQAGGGSRKGMAVAGLICAGVGAVLAILWTIVIVHASNQCGGVDQQNSSDFQQCVREHVF